MLSLDQVSNKIDDLEHGRISLDEFEDWFSVESWDVQDRGDDSLSDVVFSLESVFSRYYDDKVKRENLSQELADAVRSSSSRIIIKHWFEVIKPVFASTKPQNITLSFGSDAACGVQVPDRLEEPIGGLIRDLQWAPS